MTTRVIPRQLQELEQIIQRTAAKYPDEIVRTRHTFTPDWDGDPAIYFRIVLSDKGSNRENLADLTGEIGSKLFDDLQLAYADYIPYFFFRSATEQEKLKDPAWE